MDAKTWRLPGHYSHAAYTHGLTSGYIPMGNFTAQKYRVLCWLGLAKVLYPGLNYGVAGSRNRAITGK